MRKINSIVACHIPPVANKHSGGMAFRWFGEGFGGFGIYQKTDGTMYVDCESDTVDDIICMIGEWIKSDKPTITLQQLRDGDW